MVERTCINCLNFRVEVDTKLQMENDAGNREVVTRALLARYGVSDPNVLKALDEEIHQYSQPSAAGYRYCEGREVLAQSNDHCINVDLFRPRN